VPRVEKKSRRILVLTAALVGVLVLRLFEIDLRILGPKSFLLSCIAPSVLILTTLIPELFVKDNIEDWRLHEWRLLSPLLIFGVSELFMLLPINDQNSTAFLSGLPANPKGLIAVPMYALAFAIIAAIFACMFLAVTVPFMYSSLLEDGWRNDPTGWWTISTTFASGVLACCFWGLAILIHR